MANRSGNSGDSDRLYSLGLQHYRRWWLQPWHWKTSAPWKKSCDQRGQPVKNQIHYFADKGLYGQSYDFSNIHVRMWELDHKEGWALLRTEAFKRWCWRRLLWVSWTERRSNQLILKEISPEYTLEGLMLKLKLQYLGHLMQRTDSLEKTLMLRNIEGGRKRGQQRRRWLDGITDSMNMSLSKLGRWWRMGKPGVLQSMWSQWVRLGWVT